GARPATGLSLPPELGRLVGFGGAAPSGVVPGAGPHPEGSRQGGASASPFSEPAAASPGSAAARAPRKKVAAATGVGARAGLGDVAVATTPRASSRDRKSTRLNSSHVKISYAVFCLKKK